MADNALTIFLEVERNLEVDLCRVGRLRPQTSRRGATCGLWRVRVRLIPPRRRRRALARTERRRLHHAPCRRFRMKTHAQWSYGNAAVRTSGMVVT